MASDANDGGLLTNLLSPGYSNDLPVPWTCCCPGCLALAAIAQGGVTPGSYATTPGDDAYRFVSQAQAPQQASGNAIAALMAGSKWTSVDGASQKTVVTYSFADPQTSTFTDASADFKASLSRFSDADRQVTREVLARIEAVANVHFVEVADDASEVGVVRYGYSQQPNAMNFAAYAFFPSTAAIGGDVWIGSAQAASQWDFYRPDLILHETLHALGLKHPFGAGAALPTDQNIIPNTVMSYSPVAGGTSGLMSQYPVEPMALDIAALQYLYGASSLNADSTVYDLASAQYQTGFHAIWDAGGDNTFDASRVGRGVSLDLREDGHSDVGAKVTASSSVGGQVVNTTYTSTISIAAGTLIQNAIGSGYADTLTGNEAANSLRGGAGDDQLDGRGGDDFLAGGAGDDVLNGGDGLDTAVYEGARGDFTIARNGGGFTVSGGSEGTDSLTGVERLRFSDGAVALDLEGNAAAVAEIIGAVFGKPALHDQALVGTGLRLLDGGMSYGDLAQLALVARLGAAPAHEALVDLLYKNVVGSAPADAERAAYADQLERGVETAASLARIASETPLNLAHIDLVGLADHGLEYV